jgi:hypothetical protein
LQTPHFERPTSCRAVLIGRDADESFFNVVS